MSESVNELVFDLLLVTATVVTFTTYMLGILLGPTLGSVVGVTLVGVGLLTMVPREKWTVAALIGVIGVLLAGVVVPRFVTQFTGVADEMSLSLLVSGIILLLTIALLHITTFRQSNSQTV